MNEYRRIAGVTPTNSHNFYLTSIRILRLLTRSEVFLALRLRMEADNWKHVFRLSFGRY